MGGHYSRAAGLVKMGGVLAAREGTYFADGNIEATLQGNHAAVAFTVTDKLNLYFVDLIVSGSLCIIELDKAVDGLYQSRSGSDRRVPQAQIVRHAGPI
jgi:hypothetical protein